MHSHPACLPRFSASPTSPAIDMCAPRRGRSDLIESGMVGSRLGDLVRAILYDRPLNASSLPEIATVESLARDARGWILHYSDAYHVHHDPDACDRGVGMREGDRAAAPGDARGDRAVGPCGKGARLRHAGVAP